jgi:hypothetical protein
MKKYGHDMYANSHPLQEIGTPQLHEYWTY